ncbi:hypothetical protein BDN72DRAFT_903538 [Pluteus cervinus]|uniref:Uncharacterized protein n=1 Tax=Pluteus cervinus TaxID=181527 RepID=A0ACD3A8S6_9AGAR|nr:hypothetical protein BDN72DRAFT_903538 [Pluteus cervinus]
MLEPLIFAGLTLLAAEPLVQLARTFTMLMTHHTFRTVHVYSRRARCVWRQFVGEDGLLLLPEELLIEVVKNLEWHDLLSLHQLNPTDLPAIAPCLEIASCLAKCGWTRAA